MSSVTRKKENDLAKNMKDVDIAADFLHMQRSLEGSWEHMTGITRCIHDSMLLKISQAKLTHEVLITFMADV